MGPFQDELAFYGFVQLNMFENAFTVSDVKFSPSFGYISHICTDSLGQ